MGVGRQALTKVQRCAISVMQAQGPGCMAAPRRPQAHPGAGRQRTRAGDQAPARQHTEQGARPAWRWQRMLVDGVYAAVTEISEAEGVGESYVSRSCGWPCWCPLPSSPHAI